MQIGLITDGLGRLPLPEVLDIVADAGLTCVEVATGNWSEAPHIVEACGGQLVHTVSGLHRLIDATDADVVGANLDPSHLMWMGADIPSVISSLAGSIFHVHAKDVRVNRAVAARDGLLDATPIDRAQDRAWNYVTLGLGHPQGEAFWGDFVYQLRAAGYDGVLSIEHEDTLVSAREGVARAAALLRRVALLETPDWTPADV